MKPQVNETKHAHDKGGWDKVQQDVWQRNTYQWRPDDRKLM